MHKRQKREEEKKYTPEKRAERGQKQPKTPNRR
jgi:hypothetical protein